MNTFNKTLSRVTLVLGVTFMSAFQLYADDWKEIMYADPTIFVENGKYYLTAHAIRNRRALLSSNRPIWSIGRCLMALLYN